MFRKTSSFRWDAFGIAIISIAGKLYIDNSQLIILVAATPRLAKTIWNFAPIKMHRTRRFVLTATWKRSIRNVPSEFWVSFKVQFAIFQVQQDVVRAMCSSVWRSISQKLFEVYKMPLSVCR
jgi:hypothetical protein